MLQSILHRGIFSYRTLAVDMFFTMLLTQKKISKAPSFAEIMNIPLIVLQYPRQTSTIPITNGWLHIYSTLIFIFYSKINF